MSSRKSAIFYGILIAVVSVVTGMVLASRLDLMPASFAGNLNVPATNSAPLSGPIDSTTFRNIAREQSPAVVSIAVAGHRQATAQDMGGLNFFFGPNGQGGGRRGGGGGANQQIPFAGAGSGFIIDKAGYILTNNHVVDDAEEISVKLAGMGDQDEGLSAKVVGKDKLADVALIQLTEMPKQPLTEAKFGDSNQIAPGDWVMAIGNPFGLSGTVTVGVVSAVGRPFAASRSANGRAGRWEKMIQTDAAINPGNSGGPLLNVRGEVVGINTMIFSDQQGSGNLGVGFAVPINEVHALVPMLKTGKVARGRMGVLVDRAPMNAADRRDRGVPATGGALITRVDPGPAKDGGMKADDFVVEFNGKPVVDDSDLVEMVTSTVPGTTVPVKVYRNNKPITLNIKIGELDLSQEESLTAAPTGGARGRRGGAPAAAPSEPKTTGVGLTLGDLDANTAQQLDLPTGRGGAVVTAVDQNSQAAGRIIPMSPRGGAPDVILAVNGKSVASRDQAVAAINAIPAGASARLLIWRDGGEEVAIVPAKK
jgi:serine protease Do